jgi:hypothetical protein
MSESTSDKRYSECFNIRGLYDKKVGRGIGSNSLRVSSGHLVHLIVLVVTWFYQLGPVISRLICLLNLGHNHIGVCVLLYAKMDSPRYSL